MRERIIIVGIVAAVSIVAILLWKLPAVREWVSNHWSTVIGGLAGLLALVAAIVAATEQDKATAEQNRLLKKLDTKNDEIVKLQQFSLDFFRGCPWSS